MKVIQKNSNNLEFSSVSAMRAFVGGTGLKDDEPVYLNASSGAGWFNWDENSGATDDGVDAIKITAVANGRFLRRKVDATGVTYNQGGTGAVDRSQESKNQEYVSITDFDGVDSTGATDSSTGINYALASGAQRIRVPKGTYIADAIDLPTGGIILFGEGTIKHKDNATDHLFTAADGDVTFEGITLDGNKANNLATRFDLFRADTLTGRRVSFENVTFKHHVASSCYFKYAYDRSKITFTNCRFEDPAESTSDTTIGYPNQSLSIYGEQLGSAHLHITECDFLNRDGDPDTYPKRQPAGIQVQGQNDTSDGFAMTATDATLTDTESSFTEAMVGWYVVVEGAGTAGAQHFSRIASYTSAGEVELEDVAVTTVSAETGYWSTDSFTVTVSDCEFYRMGNGANPSAAIDIYAFGNEVLVNNNRCIESAWGGIRVADSFNSTISNNVVRGYCGDGENSGIKYQSSVRSNIAAVYNNVLIANNKVVDWLGSDAYFVVGDPAGDRYCENAVITGNQAINVLGGFRISGCGNVLMSDNFVNGVTHSSINYAGIWILDSIGPIRVNGGQIANSATYGLYSIDSTDLDITIKDVDFSSNTFNHYRISEATSSQKMIGCTFDATPTQAIIATADTMTMRDNLGQSTTTLNVSGVTTLTRWGNTFDLLSASTTVDPASIPDGSELIATIVVTGVELGDYVLGVSFSLDVQDLTLSGVVRAAGTVDVSFTNNTGGAIDLGSGTLRAVVQKV